MSEQRTYNEERNGYDVIGPCWTCGTQVAYFTDEDGTPHDITPVERLPADNLRGVIDPANYVDHGSAASFQRPPVDPPTGGTDATPSAVQTEHHEADSGQDAADRRGADPAPDPRRDPVARPPVDAAIATDWARMLDDGIAGHVLASVIRATVARLSDTGDTPDGAS